MGTPEIVFSTERKTPRVLIEDGGRRASGQRIVFFDVPPSPGHKFLAVLKWSSGGDTDQWVGAADSTMQISDGSFNLERHFAGIKADGSSWEHGKAVDAAKKPSHGDFREQTVLLELDWDKCLLKVTTDKASSVFQVKSNVAPVVSVYNCSATIVSSQLVSTAEHVSPDTAVLFSSMRKTPRVRLEDGSRKASGQRIVFFDVLPTPGHKFLASVKWSSGGDTDQWIGAADSTMEISDYSFNLERHFAGIRADGCSLEHGKTVDAAEKPSHGDFRDQTVLLELDWDKCMLKVTSDKASSVFQVAPNVAPVVSVYNCSATIVSSQLVSIAEHVSAEPTVLFSSIRKTPRVKWEDGGRKASGQRIVFFDVPPTPGHKFLASVKWSSGGDEDQWIGAADSTMEISDKSFNLKEHFTGIKADGDAFEQGTPVDAAKKPSHGDFRDQTVLLELDWDKCMLKVTSDKASSVFQVTPNVAPVVSVYNCSATIVSSQIVPVSAAGPEKEAVIKEAKSLEDEEAKKQAEAQSKKAAEEAAKKKEEALAAEAAAKLEEESIAARKRTEEDRLAAERASSAKAVNQCIVSGCGRDTWNGEPGETCCRSCKGSGGAEHGPACNKRHQAKAASQKASDGVAPKHGSVSKKRAKRHCGVEDDDIATVEYRPLAYFADRPPPGELKPCSSYVRQCEACMPDVEMLDEVVDESSRICKSLISLEKTKKMQEEHGVSNAMVLAIVVYTFDLCLLDPGKPRESNFYYVLNKQLRARSGAFLSAAHGYLHYLMAGLTRLPPWDGGKLYRGIDAVGAPRAREVYTDGRQCHWSGFSSASPSLQAAKDFANQNGPGGLVLRIRTLKRDSRSRNIQDISAFAEEEEILLMPNFKTFVVQEATLEDELGMEVIDLKEQAQEEVDVF